MKILTIAFLFSILVGVTFSNPQMPNIISDHFCSPCKSMFEEVKEKMVTISTHDISRYRETVQETCYRMLNRSEFLYKVCYDVFVDAFMEVAKGLNGLKESVIPDRICNKLHMC